jgi:hypothetical protein
VNLRRLLVIACLVALGMSPAMAQEATRLQIEISRDGSIVARPELRLMPGREGRLELGPTEKIVITPAVRDDEVALVFNIASGDRQLRPSMVISRDVRGSVEWVAADGQSIRLTVAWVL